VGSVFLGRDVWFWTVLSSALRIVFGEHLKLATQDGSVPASLEHPSIDTK
jgi:hypothetical protein